MRRPVRRAGSTAIKEGAMVSSSTEKLLKYGNWSGPGYTAKEFERKYGAAGYARILSDDERDIPGVDAYDNFVARTHDLNEVDAETALRYVLGDLGLIKTDMTIYLGKEVFTERFQYGQSGEPRFVSYRFYKTRLNGVVGDDAPARAAFAQGFANYFTHVSKSNCQFAIDSVRNQPAGSPDALWMGVQLTAAPEIFVKEAGAVGGLLDNTIPTDFGDVVDPAAIAAYLDGKFMSPNLDGVTPENNDAYTAGISRDNVLTGSGADLEAAFVAIRKADFQGDDKTEEILEIIRAGGWNWDPDDLVDAVDDLYEE
jgi:hypothetical protein